MKRVLIAAAAAALLLLSACGGDDGGALSTDDGDSDAATTTTRAGESGSTTTTESTGTTATPGDGGAVLDDAAAIEKVKTSLLDDSEDGFALEEDDAQCVAEDMVDSFGAERVGEIDFESDNLPFTPDEAANAADAFDKCMDLSELFATLFTEDYDVAASSRNCLADEIDEADARKLLEETFVVDSQGPSEATLTEIDKDFMTCLSPEEYAQVAGP